MINQEPRKRLCKKNILEKPKVKTMAEQTQAHLSDISPKDILLIP